MSKYKTNRDIKKVYFTINSMHFKFKTKQRKIMHGYNKYFVNPQKYINK